MSRLLLALFAIAALPTPALGGALAQHRGQAQVDRSERKLEHTERRVQQLEREVAIQLQAPPDPDHLERLLRRHAHQSERRERLKEEVESRIAVAGEANLGSEAAILLVDAGR